MQFSPIPEGSKGSPSGSHEARRDSGRHAARARQTLAETARTVREVTGVDTPEAAIAALEIVVGAIVRRITPSEANDLVSQLPSELEDRWLDLRAGPDREVTRERVVRQLARRLKIGVQEADHVLRGVGIALTDLVSEGEIQQVRNQLPEGLRELLWSSAL